MCYWRQDSLLDWYGCVFLEFDSIEGVYEIIIIKFVYFERAWAHRRGRESERERIPSRLLTISAEPSAGLDLMNREIMTWAETKLGA